MAINSSILAWRIPWTEEPGGLQPTGLQPASSEAKWVVLAEDFHLSLSHSVDSTPVPALHSAREGLRQRGVCQEASRDAASLSG